MTPQTANHINKQEDFAHKFLENALEIAQQQLAGMTLHGDEDGMATVEVAVPCASAFTSRGMARDS